MKGRIYIIRSKQTDKVYIGSTVETLNIRFSKHKSKQNCTSREILKYSDAEIELLECYECQDENQLRKKEGQYQKQYDCVNERIEGRTQKEYREDNKEIILEKKKEYRQKNKEKIAQHKKEYYQENREEVLKKRQEHYQENKEEILKKQQEYREKNKEVINEKKKEKFTCECGGKYILCNKSQHFKTKMHLEFLTKQN